MATDDAAGADPVRETDASADGVAFPLGGIGTGNVALGARGDLRDWELFNRPSKGVDLPMAFVGVRADPASGEAVTRVAEAQRNPPHEHWFGYPMTSTAGLPRLDGAEFAGDYPVAEIDFEDEALPVSLSLTAYTPFVPLDPEDSGIPCAVLEYEASNPTDEAVEVSLLGSLPNVTGYRGEADFDAFTPHPELGGGHNEFRDGEDLAGVYFGTDRYGEDHLRYGNFALAVLDGDHERVHKAGWPRGHQSHADVWAEFRETGRLEPNEHDEPIPEGHPEPGSAGAVATLAPGESTTVTFLLTWYLPNRPESWDQSAGLDDPAEGDGDGEESDGAANADDGGCCDGEDCCGGESETGDEDGVATVRNHYATRFDDAWDVARSVADEFDRLRDRTFTFREALFSSTLPDAVLDAVSSQLAVARSTTVMWFADGSVWGYEGCTEDAGCCPGTCTHVWNYAQSMARVFPSLERAMRRVDFEHSTDDDGYQLFRTPLPAPDGDVDLRAAAEEEGWVEHAATDGQCGTVMRLYREWLYSGDDAFLADLWPRARAALEFAIEEWDPDEDGVMDRVQHNTYDIEFHTPNSMLGTWYLGALAAGAEMARAVGDDADADRYEAILDAGRENLDETCWNGAYYEQALEDPDAEPFQYGEGCLSDQVIGQWYATTLGLGDLLPADRVEAALEAVYEHNFLTDFSAHHNPQRTYAINEDAGLLTCSWPRGGRPEQPFPYCDEVFTGIEYQVAAHLIETGHVEEGLDLVGATRDRHDGVERNPYNEFECGNHYVRAMASWAVYDALCGQTVDLTGRTDAVNEHGFAVDPVEAVDGEEFRCFWITGDAWGTYERDGDGDSEVTVLHEA